MLPHLRPSRAHTFGVSHFTLAWTRDVPTNIKELPTTVPHCVASGCKNVCFRVGAGGLAVGIAELGLVLEACMTL